MMLSGGSEEGQGSQAAAGQGGQVPTVTVVVPGRSDVARTVTASGPLAARRDQPIGVAGEGGRVTAVLVDAGNWVRAGQVLATIDRSVQSQTLAQLAAQIQVARADAALAQNEYDRSASLVSRGFVSKADLDRKKAARDAANARIRVAQANLNAMRAQVGRLNIVAPTAGLILSRNIEVGQIVSPGSGGLAALAFVFAAAQHHEGDKQGDDADDGRDDDIPPPLRSIDNDQSVGALQTCFTVHAQHSFALFAIQAVTATATVLRE
jgi:multidrug efflux pump subunit AcrA (membrane-fusion protein)